ncbi:GDSL esterase/lipase At5g45920 [Mercurialis annua]|uniref:GDSL esterase/lipase At5g45920 n=1 Tax=Mercurialis annua TaxID=3986 RepID=UPI00215F37A2|nr:GDSL esterase/lipase At5g45920 [Mercurialis annua]XP_050220783.1 GDSL esterase/lipase At5g45920 [Mercurialis annua]
MRPKIYLFGDSITEASFDEAGWGASLANHFARKADVVLRGYSGYNTRWALKVAERVFPPPADGGDDEQPLAVTVFFGANDACLADRSSAFQHVPLQEYKQNLDAIVSFFKRRWPNTTVILITPPPIDEAARLLHPYVVEDLLGEPERTNEAAGAYAKACVTAAEECECPVIDLWTKMQQFPDWKHAYLSDGLHLTQGGNKFVFEEVVKTMKENGLNAETLPVDLPLIENIDPTDPLKAFQD